MSGFEFIDPVAASIEMLTAKVSYLESLYNVREAKAAEEDVYEELGNLMESAAIESVDVFDADRIEELISNVLAKACKRCGMGLPKMLGSVPWFIVSASWRVLDAINGPLANIPDLLTDLVVPGQHTKTPDGWPAVDGFPFQREFDTAQRTLLPLGDGGKDEMSLIKTTTGTAIAVVESFLAEQPVDLDDDYKPLGRDRRVIVRLVNTPAFRSVTVVPEPVPIPVNVKVAVAEPGWVDVDAAEVFDEIALAPATEPKPRLSRRGAIRRAVRTVSPTTTTGTRASSTSGMRKILSFLGKASGAFTSVVSRRAKPAAPVSSSSSCSSYQISYSSSSSSPSSYDSSIDAVLDRARAASSPAATGSRASSNLSSASLSTFSPAHYLASSGSDSASLPSTYLAGSDSASVTFSRKPSATAVPSVAAVWW